MSNEAKIEAMKILDINAASGFWPIQPFPYQSVEELDAVYERNEIDEVWLSSVESILFPDPDVYDFALFREIEGHARFRAVKTVNPILANWRASCEKAIAEFGIKALKIYPNYHDYPLNHAELLELCEFAGSHNLPVLIPIRVNDERNQPACLQMAPVEIGNIAALAQSFPATTFVVLCAHLGELRAVANIPNVLGEISFIDDEDPLVAASKVFPISRLVFGSHAPFLYIEAAAYKLRFAQLSEEELQKVANGNIEEVRQKLQTAS